MSKNLGGDSQWQNAILSPEEVAEELSLKIETVRYLMRRRILPAAKVGGSDLFLASISLGHFLFL